MEAAGRAGGWSEVSGACAGVPGLREGRDGRTRRTRGLGAARRLRIGLWLACGRSGVGAPWRARGALDCARLGVWGARRPARCHAAVFAQLGKPTADAPQPHTPLPPTTDPENLRGCTD